MCDLLPVKIKKIFALAFVICCVNFLFGNLVSVISSNDGNGLFTYTVSSADEPYYFGGDTNLLKIIIPSAAVVSTSNPPGWYSTIDIHNTVTWRCTNSFLWYIDGASRKFSLLSSFPETCVYTGSFAGLVQGEIYNTNYSLYVSGATNAVVSQNVVGYEHFDFEGPAVPESGLLVWFIALFIFSCCKFSK